PREWIFAVCSDPDRPATDVSGIAYSLAARASIWSVPNAVAGQGSPVRDPHATMHGPAHVNHRIHPDRRHRLHLALLAGLAAHTHAVGQAASSGSSPDSASSVALATTGITTADVTSLDAVTVTGTASPAAEAKGLLDRIAGTASVVDRREVERGRSANAEDVLAYQPGVYAAATSGNSANKISIRGSG